MAKQAREIPEVESAGGVIISDEAKILFCHPTRSRWNNWRMPKGKIDTDDKRTAALREVLEETGYKCKIVARLKTELRYRTQDSGRSAWKTVTFYLMRPIEQVQQPDWEHDAFKWIPFEKAEEYAAKVEWPAIQEAMDLYREKHKKK